MMEKMDLDRVKVTQIVVFLHKYTEDDVEKFTDINKLNELNELNNAKVETLRRMGMDGVFNVMKTGEHLLITFDGDSMFKYTFVVGGIVALDMNIVAAYDFETTMTPMLIHKLANGESIENLMDISPKQPI